MITWKQNMEKKSQIFIFSLHKNRGQLLRHYEKCWNYIWCFKLWIRPLPKGNNKEVIGLMKDELGSKIIKRFAASRAEKCVTKRRLKKLKIINIV